MTLEEWVYEHQTKPNEQFLQDARKNHFISRADAHMEVFSFRPNIYSIRMEGNPKSPPVWAHLIVGEDAALLIDTGYGVGNIKREVDKLRDEKPLTVVNTHTHADHTMGDFLFPSVYVNELEADILAEQRCPESLERLSKSEWLLPEDTVVPYFPYEIVTYRGGKTFTLGKDHIIELIELPGHSPGSTVVLDRKNRILFSSDSILVKLERFFKGPGLQELIALNDRISEFDYVFPGHSALMQPPSVVTDTMNIVKRISEDPDACDFRIDRFGKGNPVFVSGDIGLIYLRERR